MAAQQDKTIYAPTQHLLDTMQSLSVDSPAHPAVSKALDQQDALASFRQRFHIPKVTVQGQEQEQDAIYLCGNSLGLQPTQTAQYVQQELTKWANLGVEGHFKSDKPWATIDQCVTQHTAHVVGAASTAEVAISNSLSVNLHILLASFYNPTQTRFKIIMEENAFCSDHHVVISHVKFRGLNPDDVIVRLTPRDQNTYLLTEDILQVIRQQGDSLALIMLGGVQYYTGQAFDMETITKVGHEQGAVVSFDLAHAAGNLHLKLHDWNVDFAAWCTYKYLNSGPGSVGGFFVHERHHGRPDLPKLTGWFGQDLSSRFNMGSQHIASPGALGFVMSNFPVLPVVCLQASLELFSEATMPALRAKSELLTAYLELLLEREIEAGKVTILTPRDPQQRGCQLSLSFAEPVVSVHERIQAAGVICDVRKPRVMRIAPTPLYNSFEDVRKFVEILKQAL